MKFNLDSKHFPHFRTLHSLAFRWTGMKSEDLIKPADMRFLGLKLGVKFNKEEKLMLTMEIYLLLGQLMEISIFT